jgi:hypothetical protein
MPLVHHFDEVDKGAIRACFFDARRHRATLHLPFRGRSASKTLCIIGQNPSAADERQADKTIRYLEELFFRLKKPRYGALLMLNLYSRVDTKKTLDAEPLHPRCAEIFDAALQAHEDFLIVCGKVKDEGSYRFLDRARLVAQRLASKHVMKLDIGTAYPPHPGNPRILYCNFDVGLAAYDFSDLERRPTRRAGVSS